MRNTVINVVDTVTTTIASGQSLSAAVNLGGLRMFGMIMPTAWTAAGLTFQMSADGTNWYNMYDANGNELTASAAASRYVAFEPANFAPVEWLKVRSGTSGTPVSQGQDSTLALVLRPV